MNKRRRPSTERNPGRRIPPRRSSNVSLNNASEDQKELSAREKSSENVQVDRATSKAEVVHDNDFRRAPKTRFSAQDGQRKLRSNSSPRLKSFPAEVIKTDCPPLFSSGPIAALIAQQDPEQRGAYVVAEPNQHGHGDQVSQPYRQVMQPQHAVKISQQQVPSHLSSRVNPQSEDAVNQQGTDKQTHYCYVPNVSHEMVAHDQTTRLRGGATALPSASLQSFSHNPCMQVQPMIESMAELKRQKTDNAQDEWTVEEQGSTPSHERQPVGGRNAVAHRRIMMQEKQRLQNDMMQRSQMIQPPKTLSANGLPILGQLRNAVSDTTPICQNNSLPGHSAQVHVQPYPDPQNPQQVYRQLQQNIACQQQMQQRARQQVSMMNNQHQPLRHHGNCCSCVQLRAMTSPQDVTINRLNNSANRKMIYPSQLQQDYNYAINPQSGWIQNNYISADHPGVVTNLKSFADDLRNSNNQRQVEYQRHQYVQPQWSCTPAIQYPQASNCNQTMQFFNQQTNESHASGQPALENVQQQQLRNNVEKKKSLQFTPAMLHDQKLLVDTMRQQGISDDLMKRQFNTLLHEQQKQLAYIEQFQQSDENLESVKSSEPVVRKKTKIDEKPDWMIHLTPPRISYDDIERMRHERHASMNRGVQEQRVRDEERLKEYDNKQRMVMQHNMNEVPFNNRQTVSPQQIQPQTQPDHDQLWQQRVANGQQRTAHPPPSYAYSKMQQKTLPSMSNRSFSTSALPLATQPQPYLQQMSQQYLQQPQYQMYTPHDPQYQIQQYQQTWHNSQAPTHAPGNLKLLNNSSQPCDRIGRTSEPSSLLKLKLYKDLIRPQKRNNGLQDPETVQKALESLKTLEGKAGYEYLASLKKPERVIKLNGTQDPTEMTPEMQSRYLLNVPASATKRIPSNGLENMRNTNNPPLRIISRRRNVEEPVELHEYPRQRQNNPRNRYSVMAEKENGTVLAQQSYQRQQPQYCHPTPTESQMQSSYNPMSMLNNSTSCRFESSQPQYYEQAQRYQRNHHYLNNNDGQGDVGPLQRSDLPGTINANRAGGDTAENSDGVLRQSARGKSNIVPAPHVDFSRTMTNGNYTQPEICEARTIGGVTFLARKPEYAPTNQFVS